MSVLFVLYIDCRECVVRGDCKVEWKHEWFERRWKERSAWPKFGNFMIRYLDKTFKIHRMKQMRECYKGSRVNYNVNRRD